MPAPYLPLRAPELVLLDLAVLVEHEHADRAELDLFGRLVPGLQRLDRRVGGCLVGKVPMITACRPLLIPREPRRGAGRSREKPESGTPWSRFGPHQDVD